MSQPENNSDFLPGTLIVDALYAPHISTQIKFAFLYRELIDVKNIETNIRALVPSFIPYKNCWYYATLVTQQGGVVHQYNGKI